jgi:hypothetical protein
MSNLSGDLTGFAYGEHLEGGSQRSLGYRLLAPTPPAAWCDEVESLARRLQAAPYPDHWPATDLFCSVLLADGQRLVALARYGLSDHTPGQRRGGLELIGVVGPAAIDVPAALALYAWLHKRRASTDDLHQLGGCFDLGTVLATVTSGPPRAEDPVPVLPVRLWQDGALLFAASSPSDPDHRLRLLEQGAGASWQWLPLVGPDFPLQTYAQRGPLLAWTAHLAGVALKLDRKTTDTLAPRIVRRSRSRGILVGLLVFLLLGLLGANLWSTLALHMQLKSAPANPPPAEKAERPTPPVTMPSEGRERFAEALAELLAEQGGRLEWAGQQAQLLDRYDHLVRRNKDLKLAEGNTKGKVAVAAVSVLAERSSDRVEELVRKALTNKGYSDPLIKAACEHVREQLQAEIKNGP